MPYEWSHYESETGESGGAGESRAPGKRSLSERLPPSRAEAATGSTAARAAPTAAPGDDPFGLHLLQAPDPSTRLAQAAREDTAGDGGAMAAQAGVIASVFGGPATRDALADLGARGAAQGDQVFVADDDPHVLGHELAHVAQGSGGGGGSAREAQADRAADAWSGGLPFSMPRSTGGGAGASPLSFYAGQILGGGDNVRVHDTPDGPMITARIPSGTAVEVTETRGLWLHVVATAPVVADGWVRNDMVRRADGGAATPTAPAATPTTPAVSAEPTTPAASAEPTTPAAVSSDGTATTGVAHTTGTNLILRAQPTTESARLQSIGLNQPIEILDGDATWVHIRHGTLTGYIMRAFTAMGAVPAAAAEEAPSHAARAPEVPILTAPGLLSESTIVTVLNDERATLARRSPAWIHALQAGLEVDAAAQTGALNAPTIQAIAAFQERMPATPTGRLDDATTAALTQQIPALATGGPAAMAAPTALGEWPTMASVHGEFAAGTFLGEAFQAHPILISRLAAAEAYLRQRFPGHGVPAIRGMLGISGRFGVERGGGSYHAMGWAIDINYSSNPWVGGQAADHQDAPDGATPQQTAEIAAANHASDLVANRHNDEADAIIWRAVWLTGHGDVYSTRDMARRGQRQTTDEIWAHAASSNAAFHAYLEGRADPALIQRWIDGIDGAAPMTTRAIPTDPPASAANRGAPADHPVDLHRELQTASAAQWQARIAADYATFHARGSNWEMTGAGQRSATTITDHHLELVRAMRDAGGLAWGASDIEGEQSGDFMHFDTRTVEQCAHAMTARARRARAAADGGAHHRRPPH